MSRLDPAVSASIARCFLPSRWHFHYVRSKLASDPLYAGVADALAGSRLPLLDVGCGIGLLAHCLARTGAERDYVGLDNDADKIDRARRAADIGALQRARFECVDLAHAADVGAPPAAAVQSHRGDVAILDVLQFLPPAAQAPLLEQAAACVAPGGRLVIRTGLAGTGWRARVTRAVDWLSRLLRWMNTGPKAYPQRTVLAAQLEACGLAVHFSPLWGGTPFNNWLVVAERPAARASA